MKFLTLFLLKFCLLASMLPPNNLSRPVESLKSDQAQVKFNEIIDKLETRFSPVIENYGAKLKVFREWENAKVNAQAFRSNTSFYIKIFGGLFRFETISEDAFNLIICHEMGHLIGGAPTFKPRNDGSSEGQADYFSTAKCFRSVIRGEDHQKHYEDHPINPLALSECAVSFDVKSEDYEICLRTAVANDSMAQTFKALGELDLAPSIDTPDPAERMFTIFNGYPNAQCRLDTLFAGSLCDRDESELNDIDLKLYNQGNCSTDKGYERGVRPLCWYVPRVDE